MKKEIIKQNVGIDIAKDDFKVCLSVMGSDLRMVVKGSRTFTNNEKGFADFLLWAEQKSKSSLVLHFTMEATGVYYEGLAYYLNEKGHPVHVVLPNQTKKYAQSLGFHTKTDKIDARMLAQFGLERSPAEWKPQSKNFRILRQLTRERCSLIQTRSQAMNHLHAYKHQGRPRQSSIERCSEMIETINCQVAAIETEIKEIVDSDEKLKHRMDYVLSIKGVSLLTAVCILSETNGFAGFHNIKQLTSYAGLDILIKESGKWTGKSKISKKGNKYIRKALYFPAFSKINHDTGTREQYERLKEKKGIAMVAAVAQQRKLLGLIYTLWKKQEMFSPAA
ncbi:MAG: IS110 family transposase [Dysgonamonadaceae bacterium]|jgi:transposase|nr:IS110 family transposase [Dysgonamonadaceae bacterium]